MVNNRLQKNKNFQKLDINIDLDKLIEHTHMIGYFDYFKRGGDQFEFDTGDVKIKDKFWYVGESGPGYVCNENESVYEYEVKEKYKKLQRISPTKIISDYDGTYFKDIYSLLSKKYKLGRMRLLTIKPMTSLSWHREVEDRIIIPITTNRGAHLIVENENKHLPADGSVWFFKSTKYHSGFNGGWSNRVHLVISCKGEI